MAKLQTAAPVFIDSCLGKGRCAAQAVVGIGLAGVGVPERVQATVGIVVFVFAALLQGAETDLQVVIELMAEVEAEGLVAVSVVIGVRIPGFPGMVDACGFFQAAVEAVAGLLIAAGNPQAAFPRALAAARDAQVGIDATGFAATGEDLHYAADGVGPVDSRA